MSNAIQTRALLTAIVSAISTAWDVPVDLGRPLTTRALPYCLVKWESVEVSFSGLGATMKRPSQKNTFTIEGRWSLPSDGTQVDLAKVDRANELIAQLQASATFATVGLLPLVTAVDNPDDVQEGAYGVKLSFEVTTLADHH